MIPPATISKTPCDIPKDINEKLFCANEQHQHQEQQQQQNSYHLYEHYHHLYHFHSHLVSPSWRSTQCAGWFIAMQTNSVPKTMKIYAMRRLIYCNANEQGIKNRIVLLISPASCSINMYARCEWTWCLRNKKQYIFGVPPRNNLFSGSRLSWRTVRPHGWGQSVVDGTMSLYL